MANLPEEILEEIFSYLALPDPEVFMDGYFYEGVRELRTLASVCRVSKTFKRFAQPLLYRHYPGQSFASLRLLVRTLLENRALARLLHSVTLEGWDVPNLVNEQHMSEPPSDEMQGLYNIHAPTLLSHDTGLQYDLLGSLQRGVQEGEIFILLAICGDIRDLRLTISSAHEDFLKLHLEGSVTLMDSVQHLTIKHWDTEGSSGLRDMQSILAVPSLTTFNGYLIDCCDMDGEFSGLEEGHRYESIESITLEASLVDAEGLRSILIACSQLRNLSITWGSAIVGQCILDFAEIGRVLREVGRSLHKLHLDPRDSFMQEMEEISGKLGSLKELENLSVLEVPHDYLVGNGDGDGEDDDLSAIDIGHVLPEKLERLGFTEALDIDDDLAEQLDEMMERAGFEGVERSNNGIIVYRKSDTMG